jgi:two-component system, NarL family, sensor histidine kinase EvgS
VRRCLAAVALWMVAAAAVAQPAAAASAATAATAATTARGAAHFREPAGRAAGPETALAASLLTAEQRAFVAALPEVRVGLARPTAEPYERLGPDGEVSGIHPEMLRLLGRAFGIRLRPVLLPSWSAALEAARNREVDLLMTMGVSSERLRFLEFTLGTTPAVGALLRRSGQPELPLERARFVVERDFLAHDYLRRQYPNAPLVVVSSTEEALRALGAGQADLYLGSLLEAAATLERQPVPGVEVWKLYGYSTGHYHFAVRKDWAPLADVLNRGIQVLRSAPNDALDTAIAQLPPELRPPPLLKLSAAESAALVRRPVWRVGAVRGLAMLNDVGVDDRHLGIAAEYTEQVARRLGVALQVQPFASVGEMLGALRAGQIDVVPFLTRTPERERDLRFSKPYIEMPYMLVTRSDGPLYWGLASLEGKRLALARQHPLRELVARDHPGIVVLDPENGNEAMDMVARGDADAAVEVKLFANLRINSANDGVLRAGTPIDELPAQFHFATSAAGADLLPAIDRALAEIPPDERQRMLRRWVAIDLVPGFPWRRYLPTIALGAGALLVVAALTLWWMRRLQREVGARRRSEQLLADIAATVPGIAFRYVLDASGAMRHVFVSPGAEAFLGRALPTDRSLLNALAPYLSAEQREPALALERASLHSGERFKATALYHPPVGPPRWLHAEAVQTLDAEGRRTWTGYVVDVSTERELQARVAREADARNLLLATASHELRAPTHNISLALQSIDEAALPAQPARALALARRAAETLIQLLDDVLDAARFDHGPVRLRPAPLVLRPLLEELADTWRVAAAARGLDFELRLVGDLPERIDCDALRLRQVLTNLLSNACKYTERGVVRLEVTRQAPAPGAARTLLELAVHDTGIGLDAAQRARLFEPFATLHDGTLAPRPSGSSGLGLVMSRRIAQAMGGTIEVRSTPGSGSVFSFVLPVAAAAGAEALPATALPPDPASVAADVAVCDDDAVSRMLVAQMLRLRGYRVREADGGAEVLSLRQHQGLRAVVTDLDMPGMSGRELIGRLREQDRTAAQRTVVVVCSGSDVASHGDELDVASQVDAYLRKPVHMDQLLRTLAELGVPPPPRATP